MMNNTLLRGEFVVFSGHWHGVGKEGIKEMARSILTSAVQSLIGSRERSARRVVANYLLGLDDATLKALGKTREEISERTF